MAKSRKQKPQEVTQAYIFEIADWEPAYHLSVNHDKRDKDLYWEHASVKITAKCIFPERFVGKITKIDLAGDRSLLHPFVLSYEKEWRPLCVGALSVKPEGAEFYAFVPYDAIFGVVSMLTANRWRYVLLHGPEVRRGKSLCQSIYFERTVSLEDY